MTPPTAPRPPSPPVVSDEAEIDAMRPARPRAMRVGIGISVVLHLVAIAFYPVFRGAVPTGIVNVSDSDAEPLDGIQLLDLRDEEEVVDRPDDPNAPPEIDVRRPEVPGIIVGDPAIEAPEIEPPPPGLTVAERLRDSYGDDRLRSPIPYEFVNPSPEQIAQARLRWAVEALVDSATIAAAAEADAVDWTWTDDDGKKWGIGDGKIHLGDFTLPLPEFGTPYDQDAWMGSKLDELQRAALSAEAFISNRERAKALRARIEEERRRAQRDTTSGR